MSFYVYQIAMEIEGQTHDVAILYKYSNGHYDRQLDETIDQITKRRLPPERILIVCPRGLQEGVREDYTGMNPSTKERLRGVTNVVLAAFNHRGQIESEFMFQLHALAEPWQLNDSDIETIVGAGMKNIVETTETRMTAPPGYVFRKPSEKASRFFIRAGNMIKNPSALAVVFHAMVRTIPIGAKRLYIDSFTILSIALTYQRCMTELAKKCGVEFEVPTITNFHSYSMDPNLTFEVTADYLVLISASSSGGLAQKLIKEHHAQTERVFHLLSFSNNDELRKSSVYFQEEPKQETDTDGSFQKVISIPGEEFLASHGDTRTVELKIKHVVPSERKIYKEPFYQEVLGLNLHASGSYGSAFRPIGFGVTGKLGSDAFEKWIELQARITLPASTTIAIAADDKRSKLLAEHLVSLIPTTEKGAVPVITLADLQGDKIHKKISANGSILVVCSDESDGESLLAISQSLRDKPHLHRHYVIGHLFPSSVRQFRRLKSNLRVNGKGKEYGWSVYCVTPLGEDSVHQSWLLERNLGYEITAFHEVGKSLVQALQKRVENLNGSVLTGDALFLPKINGEPLCLREESIFFEDPYENISQVTIYLQIAAALQRARDRELCDGKTVLPSDLCFDSNPFIDTVIDPDTFSRFNDGVIQAAILRSATASELNYSRDLKLSNHMLGIVSAIIMSRQRDRGEAVLEFMLAAHLKKLRFHNDHFSIVRGLIEAEPELNAVWLSFSPRSPL
jgi:hypothetical protein